MPIATTTSILSTMSNLFGNLILPLLVAVLGTSIWNFVLERKRKEAERKEKLYGPLRFYLMMMKNNKVTMEQLRENMRQNHKKWSKGLDSKKSGELLIESSNQFSREIVNPAVSEWWSYADTVESYFKNHSGLIKKNDWSLVKNFSSSLFLRKMAVGKATPKNTYNLFTDEMTTNATEQIFEAVNRLQDKILK